MLRTVSSIAGFIATVAVAGSVLAQPVYRPTPIQPGPSVPPLKTIPPLKPLTCNVDPAIVSITLSKGAARGQVAITYQINNLGRSAWRSGGNQQGAHLRAHNGNTGHTFTDDSPLPGAALAGAVMLRRTTPMIPNAFDDFEFGGFVELQITYDPDIYIDGNTCNDDANSANNRFRIENGDILGFMRGAARTRTFTR